MENYWTPKRAGHLRCQDFSEKSCSIKLWSAVVVLWASPSGDGRRQSGVSLCFVFDAALEGPLFLGELGNRESHGTLARPCSATRSGCHRARRKVLRRGLKPRPFKATCQRCGQRWNSPVPVGGLSESADARSDEPCFARFLDDVGLRVLMTFDFGSWARSARGRAPHEHLRNLHRRWLSAAKAAPFQTYS